MDRRAQLRQCEPQSGPGSSKSRRRLEEKGDGASEGEEDGARSDSAAQPRGGMVEGDRELSWQSWVPRDDDASPIIAPTYLVGAACACIAKAGAGLSGQPRRRRARGLQQVWNGERCRAKVEAGQWVGGSWGLALGPAGSARAAASHATLRVRAAVVSSFDSFTINPHFQTPSTADSRTPASLRSPLLRCHAPFVTRRCSPCAFEVVLPKPRRQDLSLSASYPATGGEGAHPWSVGPQFVMLDARLPWRVSAFACRPDEKRNRPE